MCCFAVLAVYGAGTVQTSGRQSLVLLPWNCAGQQSSALQEREPIALADALHISISKLLWQC